MTKIDFRRITRKWSSLRRFAGLTVGSSLDAIKSGRVDIAKFYSGLLYFLPFAPRSLEKVLIYCLIKASYGYVKKEPSRYSITVDEVPGFEPDEKDIVMSAFESIVDMGLAIATGPTVISLKPEVINDIVRPIAPHIAKMEVQPMDIESSSHTYRVVSGVSSAYVMHKGGRLPKCYTLLAGLVSPVGKVEKSGEVEVKHTIENQEWDEAKNNMSKLRLLKHDFELEYFKALGVMFENKIVVNVMPTEISGLFIENVVKPAYWRYYALLRRRPRGLRA